MIVMGMVVKSRPHSSAKAMTTSTSGSWATPQNSEARSEIMTEVSLGGRTIWVSTATLTNPQADAYAIGEAHEHYDAMLHRMDADGDGVLTKQEALDVGDDILLDDQQAGIRLDDVVSADINGDSKLERHEWIKHRSGFARKDEL